MGQNDISVGIERVLSLASDGSNDAGGAVSDAVAGSEDIFLDNTRMSGMSTPSYGGSNPDMSGGVFAPNLNGSITSRLKVANAYRLSIKSPLLRDIRQGKYYDYCYYPSPFQQKFLLEISCILNLQIKRASSVTEISLPNQNAY